MSGKTCENDKVYSVFSASAADITVPKGGCIIREGEHPQYLYFIRQGEVQLSKPSAEEKVFTFEKKRPGQLLAASHLFNPIPSLFQADSIEDSRLLRLPITDIENLTAHDYEFAVALFKQLNAENGVLLSQCRDYIFCGSRQEVYAVLIRLAEKLGCYQCNHQTCKL
ncbi:Crp/Fnr family transcriptional regulator [Salisediminibacterium halotolerans]|uniref:Cyclic nucleotide-binding domain-containing protein n=1 Tax=Salisediminibacterium halotolerans TaxID=517425 RepID=A0A1H9WSX0_9BACI|nr:Crp/Fnr family transcriptional regulator [Salisediminibacterium haloalkalitolerans]SES37042.1 Cyclic nucleotide-binding domain-containing protein [Salisediminibacterium haloalkalitolerans]